jgi:hypothetical protein
MRRYPRIDPEGFRGVDGPAVLPLFCLAPHGVFRASQITPRAVSSYLAFSPLPELRCRKPEASSTLPKNRRCLFCDTFRRRDLTIAAPASFTRHAAVWCSDFPPASLTTHQRSSAIALILAHETKSRKSCARTKGQRSRRIFNSGTALCLVVAFVQAGSRFIFAYN